MLETKTKLDQVTKMISNNEDQLESTWIIMNSFMKAIRHPVFVQDETYQQAILQMVTMMWDYYKDLKEQTKPE